MNKLAKKKVLVCGGAGFLGSHLCEKLLSIGHEVICVDNYYSSNGSNISKIIGNKNFQFIKHDILDPININVDQIYNLACPASPIHYQRDPIYTMKVNVIGIFNLLKLAKLNKAKIFQASTSEVYGDPDIHPQTESYWGHVNPIGIRSCYDEGKRAVETILFDSFRQEQTQIKIARIFNTYGPGMHLNDGRVISNFILQALTDEDITIYGQGIQTRSFCYVDDMINAFINLMETDDSFQGPINLGNPFEIKIIEIAKIILEKVGSKSKLVFKELPLDDPLQRCPDIKLAKSFLDWEPLISLDEGIERTIEYFKEFI